MENKKKISWGNICKIGAAIALALTLNAVIMAQIKPSIEINIVWAVVVGGVVGFYSTKKWNIFEKPKEKKKETIPMGSTPGTEIRVKQVVHTEEEYKNLLIENARLGERIKRIATIEEFREVETEGIRKASIAECDRLKELIREQTENDLFVTALRGLGIIPKFKGQDTSKEFWRLLELRRESKYGETF